ncbi:hypothetical protein B0T17DRAFT_568373 [Bombardia bombarda]|uniref:Ketoreductase domain-containing protein n=1 Tax=Bombardia bombarda TaxID=252184 RepID=A0AA39XK94_9PEZI|nr:hypothetical protein B0T17DRAFT_568373 [Bombardia bombarda]
MATHYTTPPQRDSWFAPLSIDMFVKVLKTSFFHPFIAWIVPLCFRAQNMYWDATPMLVSIFWAAFVSSCWIVGAVNNRLAFGLPREVDLSEEVIVITGGASGLGLLIAEVYGMRGAAVAVLDTKEMENGEARGVTYYKCDVTDKDQIARVAAEIERDLGTPTVLINNAAVVTGKRLLDTPIAAIERSLATNLTSHFYTLKTFLPAIARSPVGGTIVTVSSAIGHVGAAKLADYAAAKAGVTALHKSLAAELRETHPQIRTVLVTPGQLSTPLFYGVQTPSAFFAPVVEPVDVAKAVIAAIDNGQNAAIGMPLYARWVDWYNVLPLGVQAVVRGLAGVDRGMETFVGRAGERQVGVGKGKGEPLIQAF